MVARKDRAVACASRRLGLLCAAGVRQLRCGSTGQHGMTALVLTCNAHVCSSRQETFSVPVQVSARGYVHACSACR